MSGSEKLTDEQKLEMLEDAASGKRREAFRRALETSGQKDLDAYVKFLSEIFELIPRKRKRRKTDGFKL